MTVHPFMLWNLYLAAIPAVVALVLFRKPGRTGVTWFLGFAVWMLFLPNAPYVLTDVMHLRADLYASPSRMHTYIGRFMRVNSWDVVFAPHTVIDAVVRIPRPSSLAVFVVMFFVIGFGTFSTYAVGEKLLHEVRRLTTR